MSADPSTGIQQDWKQLCVRRGSCTRPQINTLIWKGGEGVGLHNRDSLTHTHAHRHTVIHWHIKGAGTPKVLRFFSCHSETHTTLSQLLRHQRSPGVQTRLWTPEGAALVVWSAGTGHCVNMDLVDTCLWANMQDSRMQEKCVCADLYVCWRWERVVLVCRSGVGGVGAVRSRICLIRMCPVSSVAELGWVPAVFCSSGSTWTNSCSHPAASCVLAPTEKCSAGPSHLGLALQWAPSCSHQIKKC